MLIDIGKFRQRLFAQFPFVQFIIEQERVSIVKRPVDMRWHYKGVIPISVAGFNPLRHRIFYGEHSYFQKLIEVEKNARCERTDWLLYETFFIVHDYMHIWAISKMLPSFPHCLDDNALSNPVAIADLAFILLMSEAVATVSIDWWTLARFDLSSILKSRTNFRCLTTTFQMTGLSNAQTIDPTFQVMGPNFFEWLATGYCTGEFAGFDSAEKSALRQHAPWIEKEKEYGKKQREFILRWIGYLSQDVKVDSQMHFQLNTNRCDAIRSMASDLWSIFGDKLPSELSVCTQFVALPSKIKKPEFEFVDLAHAFPMLSSMDLNTLTDRQFGFLSAQWVSYRAWGPKLGIDAEKFDLIIRDRDVDALKRICGSSIPSGATISNPCLHLFLPN